MSCVAGGGINCISGSIGPDYSFKWSLLCLHWQKKQTWWSALTTKHPIDKLARVLAIALCFFVNGRGGFCCIVVRQARDTFLIDGTLGNVLSLPCPSRHITPDWLDWWLSDRGRLAGALAERGRYRSSCVYRSRSMLLWAAAVEKVPNKPKTKNVQIVKCCDVSDGWIDRWLQKW